MMENLINRTVWFVLATVGTTFLGIAVLFLFLGGYIAGLDLIGVFKWILLIFLFVTGGIGALVFLGATGVGLKMRFSSKKDGSEQVL